MPGISSHGPTSRAASSDAGSDESVCQYGSFALSGSTVPPVATDYDSLRWMGGLGSFDDPTVLHPVYQTDMSELGGITLSLIAYRSWPCANDTSSMLLTVLSAPVASFTILPGPAVCAGVPLDFESTGTDVVAWDWDFGDGQTASGQVVSHAY